MELNYKRLGEGKPLIILHGLFGSLDNWMSFAKQWSSSFEVWLIDQRNHGQSAHSSEFSYQHMAIDLKEFMEHHQIKDPMILGHSMGGKTAMEFSVQYPHLLNRLMVVDIAPVSYQVHHYAIIDALEEVKLETIQSRKDAEAVLSKTIEEFGVRQFLLKNLYWKEKEELAWRFNLAAIKNEIVPISDWSISDGVYPGKTMFIKGANSEYILPTYAHAMAQKFPNYELEVIENAGHWVHAEAPKAFDALVQSFMKD